MQDEQNSPKRLKTSLDIYNYINTKLVHHLYKIRHNAFSQLKDNEVLEHYENFIVPIVQDLEDYRQEIKSNHHVIELFLYRLIQIKDATKKQQVVDNTVELYVIASGIDERWSVYEGFQMFIYLDYLDKYSRTINGNGRNRKKPHEIERGDFLPYFLNPKFIDRFRGKTINYSKLGMNDHRRLPSRELELLFLANDIKVEGNDFKPPIDFMFTEENVTVMTKLYTGNNRKKEFYNFLMTDNFSGEKYPEMFKWGVYYIQNFGIVDKSLIRSDKYLSYDTFVNYIANAGNFKKFSEQDMATFKQFLDLMIQQCQDRQFVFEVRICYYYFFDVFIPDVYAGACAGAYKPTARELLSKNTGKRFTQYLIMIDTSMYQHKKLKLSKFYVLEYKAERVSQLIRKLYTHSEVFEMIQFGEKYIENEYNPILTKYCEYILGRDTDDKQRAAELVIKTLDKYPDVFVRYHDYLRDEEKMAFMEKHKRCRFELLTRYMVLPHLTKWIEGYFDHIPSLEWIFEDLSEEETFKFFKTYLAHDSMELLRKKDPLFVNYWSNPYESMEDRLDQYKRNIRKLFHFRTIPIDVLESINTFDLDKKQKVRVLHELYLESLRDSKVAEIHKQLERMVVSIIYSDNVALHHENKDKSITDVLISYI